MWVLWVGIIRAYHRLTHLLSQMPINQSSRRHQLSDMKYVQYNSHVVCIQMVAISTGNK